jgi:sulfur-oxidizing protein SoxY
VGVKHLKWMAAFAALFGLTAAGAARAQQDDEATRAARWQDLQHAIFGARKVEDGSAFIAIDAPVRALDAALVPVSLSLKGTKPVKGIYFVIDDNPAPIAGHFTFGPEGDPRSLKLRVRVDSYTYMHAIVETQDGTLYSAQRFIKAAGGCSAPSGSDEQEALLDIGHIKVKFLAPFAAGRSMQAQLMIKHPNFNGMQMNQISRTYTPARFIKSIDVSFGDAPIMHVDSNISLATDPVITFGFVPPQKGQLKVEVQDTKNARFDDKFDLPAPPG